MVLVIQNTVDEVQVLIRKHEDFEATTQAHDERIKQLTEQANRLIHGGHYDIPRLIAAHYTKALFRSFSHQSTLHTRHIYLSSRVRERCVFRLILFGTELQREEIL